MEASYRVARQFSHSARWARVTASVDIAAQDSVAVAASAFAWREYPPGPYGDDLSAEAVEGVRYALARLPGDRPRYRVTITKIEDAPVDTGPGDVKVAAAHATWAALAFVPDEPPWISEDGPVFPN